MTLSIVTPVYNVAPYLPATIESILNQTFKDFELILIDDGSTDGSDKICLHYANLDNRVRVIRQTNQEYPQPEIRELKHRPASLSASLTAMT